MKLYTNLNITSGDDIEFEVPIAGDVMDQKKDFSALIKAVGGHTGAADVTMSVSIFADIKPAQTDQEGTVVDIDAWTNITPAAYRLDQNAMVDNPTVEFSGVTAENAWLDFDNLNADKIKFVVSFDAAPAGTPAQLIVKIRRDDT